MRHFDLVVIGTGPAGQKAAIQASKLGKDVGIIEKKEVVGGSCLHTGTIPSKALREAVMALTGTTGQRERSRPQKKITLDDVIFWSNRVIRSEMEIIEDQMMRNGVELIRGTGRFEDAHTLKVTREHSSERVTGDYFVIATGTTPAHDPMLPYDNINVVDSDGLLHLKRLPRSMVIVGGGVIGTEYACILATLGVQITLIEGRDSLLGFVDHEVIEALQYHMRQVDITLRLGERVERVELSDPENRPGFSNSLVRATLESGKHIRSDTLMYCIGRSGATQSLGLENVGLETDHRGRIKVNEFYQSEVPHVYAAGDVIGFPALASTSMEQGRLAACHIFGGSTNSFPELFPYGIYAIPEISMVGKTEGQLTEEGIPYEMGIARYKECARGQLLGDDIGMLKMLVHEETRELLGVHIIGTGATELIHIGQVAMAHHGTLDFFIQNVFNYPTLAEAYKIAALNANNKLATA
ncbi:Soluble pyridine nucleotide transhydrogenase [Planctomycetes bacterium Pan216]|uniref:Soluble pyridine nucleotide transhydrogenase n=1 Tax=Kolteria novifilia TaxID=2527975 RepID=A0A518B3D3_9BACT|nr:Soluble pyridine nucleotide transhydrogenase [Planctomycetes bacterium Pan216]